MGGRSGTEWIGCPIFRLPPDDARRRAASLLIKDEQAQIEVSMTVGFCDDGVITPTAIKEESSWMQPL